MEEVLYRVRRDAETVGAKYWANLLACPRLAASRLLNLQMAVYIWQLASSTASIHPAPLWG